MASRMIHAAVANMVSKTYTIRDYDRFLFGQMLPDAYADGKNTSESHLKICVCHETKKTYDLERFRKLFSEELKWDDLYRGYYLHLIQDVYFRDFIYHRYHWNSAIPGNIEKLHRDYALINRYVIEAYQMKDRLIIPQNFQKERINQLYPFGIQQLESDFHWDFEGATSRDTFFFTADMADEFIQIAYRQSVKELQALDHETFYTDMLEMAWERNT